MNTVKKNSRVIDRTGQSFGRLTVLSLDHQDDRKRTYWLCSCSCGNRIVVKGDNLASGGTKSCGCVLREVTIKRLTKHGRTNTKEFRTWCGIKSRCNNPSHQDYGNYGGRGIKVYPAWEKSFEVFLKDIGKAPSKEYSIDRINVDGDYEPSNVRWITNIEQQNNKRNTVFLSLNGVTLSLPEWSRRLNIKKATLFGRVYHGWSDERTLTTQPGTQGRWHAKAL